MITYVHKHHVPFSELLRWTARTSAVSLFVAWLGLVVLETMRSGPPTSAQILYQAAALAVVFVGYAIGWRSELAGGVMTIIGTAAFFVANEFSVGVFPPLEAVWFAAPGILYVMAWLFGDRHRAMWLPTAANRARRDWLSRNGGASF